MAWQAAEVASIVLYIITWEYEFSTNCGEEEKVEILGFVRAEEELLRFMHRHGQAFNNRQRNEIYISKIEVWKRY